MTADTLLSDFVNVVMFSRPSIESGWLGWSGSSIRPSIAINAPLPSIAHLFPPLLSDSSVPEPNLHVMDRLLSGTVDGLTVVKRERLGEFNTLLVERSSIRPWPEGMDPELQKRVVLTEVIQCWLDIEHGYVPRRICREARWFCDGQRRTVGHFTNGVPPIIADVVISKIPGRGYYPTGGKLQMWTHRQDRNWPTPLEIFDGKKAAPEVTNVLMEELTWNAIVDIPAQMPEFDLIRIAPPTCLVID